MLALALRARELCFGFAILGLREKGQPKRHLPKTAKTARTLKTENLASLLGPSGFCSIPVLAREGPAFSKHATPKAAALLRVLDSSQTQMRKKWAETDFSEFFAKWGEHDANTMPEAAAPAHTQGPIQKHAGKTGADSGSGVESGESQKFGIFHFSSNLGGAPSARHPFYTGRIFDSTLGYPGEGPALSKLATPKAAAQFQILETIQKQMEKKWAETDFSEFLAELGERDKNVASIPHTKDPSEIEWLGHDMSLRPHESGLRTIVVNVAKKLLDIESTRIEELEDGTRKHHSMKYLDHLLDYMEELKGDIMVINEPGLVWSSTNHIEAKAQAYQMEAIVATTEHSKAAGLVIILGPKWRKVKTMVGIPDTKSKRLVTIEFKGAVKKPHEPLPRLLFLGAYGVNSPSSSKKSEAESDSLWASAFSCIEEFRSSHPLGSVVLAGDLNAAKSSSLDTNRSGAQLGQREKDATIITAIEGLGLHDTFRVAHPALQAWTREPTGELQHTPEGLEAH